MPAHKLILLSILVLLSACSNFVPDRAISDIGKLITPSFRGGFDADLLAHPNQSIPLIFAHAENSGNGLNLLRIIRSENSNGSYFLFLGDTAIFSTLHDEQIIQRGVASYSETRMQKYIKLIENAGICYDWQPTLLKRLHKEYVLYKASNTLRACYGPRLIWRSESEFMQSFWQIIDMENLEWICGDPENFNAC